MDDAATRPIVWVCGAPGSGKTTLAASYLEARRLPHLWYQCDAGDADPATLLHYLRTAAQQVAGAAAGGLPRFTSEPHQDLARFARGFFRDLFAALPRPCAIAFDNFHELESSADALAAFAQGLEEVPEQVTVIAVSRAEPPPQFARLVVSGRIARLDETELRCTVEEAEAILGPVSTEQPTLARIQRQCDGWVAALVLMREHLRRRGATFDDSLGGGKEAIFHYFAGEIFHSARPENQRLLMLTAIPPSITVEDAVALTGDDEAPRLLEYLYRHHLFTDRRRGDTLSYQYHALFREFLLDQLGERIPLAERRAAMAKAAHGLAARGQQSEALALFREAGEWEAMRTLIRAHALEWARQGRGQALSDWVDALPAEVRKRDPWLVYWAGRAWVFVHPARGRPAVEAAFEAFRAADDVRGEALALSTIVTSYYYEWASFAPLDRWRPALERLVDRTSGAPLDPESELRVLAALLIVLLLRDAQNEKLPQCARRLDELIDAQSDANLRVMAASVLFNYVNWNTRGEAAPSLVARIEPILAKPEVTPLMQVWWRTNVSFWHFHSGRYVEATKVITEARAIAEHFGLEAHLVDIDHAEASALINKGEHQAAKPILDAMERRLSPLRRMQWPFYHHLRSVLEQRLGRAASAAHHAERAVALVRELDIPSQQMPHFLARLAQARAALGERDAAMQAIDEAIARATPVDRPTFEQRRITLQIEADLAAGEMDRAAAGLAIVFGDLRARGDYVFMRSRPDLAARFANLALERDIETGFVRALIERDKLVAPPDACTAWPFRLRLRVLNGFELARDGEPVRFSGKTQQRPLDLLKLAIALGGSGVDAEHVMGVLWPDADGAAAKNSFDSTLSRLRKLLDVEDAIELTSSKLSLARALVWTDVWALDAAIEHAREAVESGRTKALLERAAQRLVDAYPGPLLATEEAAWVARPREALRARVVRTLTSIGERLEREGDWVSAIAVYRRGLEADNLSEAFYRGLMRSLAATGDHAEALNVFRRCRELLSIVLGMAPSAETNRLHQEIVAASRRPA